MQTSDPLSLFVNILVLRVLPIVVVAGGTILVVKFWNPVKDYFLTHTSAQEQATIAAVFAEIAQAAEASRLKAEAEGQAWAAAEWAVKAAADRLAYYGIHLDRDEIVAGLRAALLQFLATLPDLLAGGTGAAVVQRGLGTTPTVADRAAMRKDLAARLWV